MEGDEARRAVCGRRRLPEHHGSPHGRSRNSAQARVSTRKCSDDVTTASSSSKQRTNNERTRTPEQNLQLISLVPCSYPWQAICRSLSPSFYPVHYLPLPPLPPAAATTPWQQREQRTVAFTTSSSSCWATRPSGNPVWSFALSATSSLSFKSRRLEVCDAVMLPVACSCVCLSGE